MPTPDAILAGLTVISNAHRAVAIAWHLVLATVVMALLVGWRPRARTAAGLLAVPVASVCAFAWVHDNPFNGTVFLLLTVALAVLATSLPNRPVEIARGPTLLIGVGLLLFGWLYPHFLQARSLLAYLYATPVGLIPCPTLSVTVGLALIVRAFRSRAYAGLLAATAAFYGLFGALRLGVWIDSALVAGATALAAVAWRPGAGSDSEAEAGSADAPAADER